MGYLVSFCIPTYNNAEGIYKTVTELLKNKNENFQVVVVDNASQDNTVERMSGIDDLRLKFLANSENQGAKLNWYKVLEAGDGEWLYLVMGRDMLDCENLDRFLKLLNHVNSNVGFLLDRNKDQFPKFYSSFGSVYEGINAVTQFIDMMHPTGSIFRRAVYREIKNRKNYFLKEHPYPENYIKRDILVKYCGACIDGKLYRGKYNINFKRKRSQFEGGASVPYYYPQKRLEQFLCDVNMVENSGKFDFSTREYETYFLKRWTSLLDIISVKWKDSLESALFTGHYGIAQRHVSKFEMIDNMIKAYISVLKYYKSRNKLDARKKIKMWTLVQKYIVDILFGQCLSRGKQLLHI